MVLLIVAPHTGDRIRRIMPGISSGRSTRRTESSHPNKSSSYPTSSDCIVARNRRLKLAVDLMKESFPKGKYADVLGLCKVAMLNEIEAQRWSLNPGRYVGVAERAADDFEFAERLEELNEELEKLNGEARELEERIAENVEGLLNPHA
jgi:type I restriction-modification system DNA methylase subunit